MPPLLVRIVCLLCLAGSAFSVGAEILRTGCPAAGQVHVPGGALTNSDFVELHRGACYGSCPDYTVRISADGSAAWMGKGSVRTPGKASGQVAAQKAKALIEQFRSVEFWSLCAGYAQGMTDLSTYETVVGIGGQVKTVSDYADSSPAFLRKLDLQIDELAGTHRWRHGPPENELFGSRMSECYLPKPGVTPLMCRAAQSDATLGDLLHAENVNARDSSGWTPLMYAASSGSDKVFEQLMDAGADPKAVSSMRQTVMMSVISGYTWTASKMVRLRKAGCDVNAADSTGATALMLAMPHFWLSERVEWLMANGARTSLKDARGKSAINYLNDTYAQMRGKASGEEASYRKVLQLLQRATH